MTSILSLLNPLFFSVLFSVLRMYFVNVSAPPGFIPEIQKSKDGIREATGWNYIDCRVSTLEIKMNRLALTRNRIDCWSRRPTQSPCA